MELDHEFTVPVPVDQAWSVLLDVERVAACMPGATLDSVDGEEYAGRLKVKVGAMTITYRGTARITAADEKAGTVTLEASAKEARGSGTAAATVVSRLHDEGGSTRVTVHTKLNVTGRPAQFGRNILSEVGGKLISRFAKALAEELENPASAAADTAPADAAAAGTAPSDTTPADTTARDPKPTDTAATDTAGTDTAGTDTAGTDTAGTDTAGTDDVVKADAGDAAPGEIAAAAAAPAEPPSIAPKVPQQRPASPIESTAAPDAVVSPIRPRRDAGDDDAIDLLEVAGPSVAKRAVPAAGALLLLVLAIRFLVRRRRKG
ncbi:SRPBCC family protein [Spirillospora sp. NPDC029432]|uniref:SRPBCC family protein n=1 Tax=Spirillospora sp. NPDC029432 TaxID=3154599 RepID=UPI0034522B6C